MTLYIKNMVCNRCKAAVDAELQKLGLRPAHILLGEVELAGDQLSAQQLQQLDTALQAAGFELIDDRKTRMIEKIKNVVVSMVHYSDSPIKEKHSELIARELHYDYPYLSNLFSDLEGITIEQYIIQQKVEKIKEYIAYDELSLSAIADKMGYSSTAHLSAQFKKITGMPPSQFQNKGVHVRKGLDEVGR